MFSVVKILEDKVAELEDKSIIDNYEFNKSALN